MKNRCLRTGDKSHHTHGVPEEAPATTTLFDMWHHPINPTYNSVHTPQVKMLPKYGYALVEEELSKRELDDDVLSKENDILQKRQRLKSEDAVHNLERTSNMLDENAQSDMNSNYVDANNNSSRSSVVKRNKSSLNTDEDDLPSCPGLASAAVVYKLD